MGLPTVPDMAGQRTTKIAWAAMAFALTTALTLTAAAPVDAAATTTQISTSVHGAPGLVPTPAAPMQPTPDRQVRAAWLSAKAAKAKARSLRIRHTRDQVVKLARRQVGDTYSAGGNGPDRFDCSGLTQYVFKKAAGKHLPHHSRAQWANVKRIPKAKAQPGDLVFFFEGGAHHVGIYIGNGRMVDARGYGEGVRISPIKGSWWGRSFTGMGRILPPA